MSKFKYPPDFKGVFIPKEIWMDDRLTPTEKILWAEIDSLDGEEGCYASNTHLMKYCKSTKATLERSLKRLKEFDLIYPDGYRSRCRVWRSSLKMRQVPASERGNIHPQNEAPVIQESNTTEISQPAKKPVDLRARYDKALKEDKLSSVLLYGMEMAHGSQYANYPKERKAAAGIEKMLRYGVMNGATPIEVMGMMVKAYLKKRKEAKSDYWKTAPISPSGLRQRWDETFESAKTQGKTQEVMSWFQKAKIQAGI